MGSSLRDDVKDAITSVIADAYGASYDRIAHDNADLIDKLADAVFDRIGISEEDQGKPRRIYGQDEGDSNRKDE